MCLAFISFCMWHQQHRGGGSSHSQARLPCLLETPHTVCTRIDGADGRSPYARGNSLERNKPLHSTGGSFQGSYPSAAAPLPGGGPGQAGTQGGGAGLQPSSSRRSTGPQDPHAQQQQQQQSAGSPQITSAADISVEVKPDEGLPDRPQSWWVCACRQADSVASS